MKSEKRKKQQALSRKRLDRAAQWMKGKFIEEIHLGNLDRLEHATGRLYNEALPVCEICGLENTLQPDHVNGKKWRVRSTNQVTRLLRYVAEWQAGEPFRVLCKKCNERDGAQQRKNGHRVKPNSEVSW